tara:strand:- start:870 stop:1268 length:399 start_codon:yes stop_codon:yes gene_type:complete
MPGFSFSLPVYTDDIDGFKLNKTYIELAQQNLKCLLLTNPGEKLMYPGFGAGIKRFLFEPMTQEVYSKMRTVILKQTRQWLPYISILGIDVEEPGDPNSGKPVTNANQISVGIAFEVVPIGQVAQVKLYFNL